MSENETSEVLHPSDEVEAYPLVLKLCAINWVTLAAEITDADRVAAFGLAAAYCSAVVDDYYECQAIGEVSGLNDICTKAFKTKQGPIRPLYF